LTITRALVEAHGGRITAHSGGRDQGTTFIVEFAVHVPATAERAESPREPVPAAGGLRVLLVEDHDGTRKAMLRLLAAMGHQATAAGSMKEALQAAEAGTFDLVVSDIGLPDATGLVLIRRLRELFAQRGDNVRAIAVSGYGMDSDIRASREAGFDAHLTKPVSPDQLAQAIANAKGGELATAKGDGDGSVIS